MTPGGVRAPGQTPRGRRRARRLLGSLRVPTLVLHRTDDQLIDVRHSRYLAEHVPGARYVELEGIDSLPDASATPRRCSARSRSSSPAAARAAIDARAARPSCSPTSSDATARAARMGDGRWRDLLAAHDDVVRRERRPLRRPRGQDDRRRLPRDLRRPAVAGRALRAGDRRRRSARSGSRSACGLHTGECELHRRRRRRHGRPHRRARRPALAAPGEVLASGTIYGTVVGSGLDWEDRGMQALNAACPGTGRCSRCAVARSSACRPQPSAAGALLGCVGKPPEQEEALMRSRIRKALNVRANGPWILASALLVALLVAPFAVAFGEGNSVRGGARNPSPTASRRTPRRRRSSPTSGPTARASPTSPTTAAARSTAAARRRRHGEGQRARACAPATWPTAARSSSTPTATEVGADHRPGRRGAVHHERDGRGHRPERRPGRRQERRRDRRGGAGLDGSAPSPLTAPWPRRARGEPSTTRRPGRLQRRLRRRRQQVRPHGRPITGAHRGRSVTTDGRRRRHDHACTRSPAAGTRGRPRVPPRRHLLIG